MRTTKFRILGPAPQVGSVVVEMSACAVLCDLLGVREVTVPVPTSCATTASAPASGQSHKPIANKVRTRV